MAFKRFAAMGLMPTLARLILAAAFISVGYNKLFTLSSFSSEEATILRAYGVEVQPAMADVDDVAWRHGAARVAPVAFLQDAEDTAASADEPMAPPADAVDDAAPSDAPAALDDVDSPAAPGQARSLYKITLMLHGADLPSPKWGAWLAAITEFAGGALLLIGFLSRIWGLGLSFAMGVAFYLVTMRFNGLLIGDAGYDIIAFSRDIPAFNTMFSQLGLGTLALFILLVGPGPLSIDRLLFGKSKRHHEEQANEQHEHGQAWHSAASRGVAAPAAQAGAVPNAIGARPAGSPPPGRPASPLADAAPAAPPPPAPSENIPLEEQRGVRGEKPASPKPDHHAPHGDKGDGEERELPPRRPL